MVWSDRLNAIIISFFFVEFISVIDFMDIIELSISLKLINLFINNKLFKFTFILNQHGSKKLYDNKKKLNKIYFQQIISLFSLKIIQIILFKS